MMKNRKLSKSIGDVGWSQFIGFLTYKCDWFGVNLLTIGRFDPSSKMCSCGKINQNLKLSDRTWKCSCGKVHDRDILAANNILKFAFVNVDKFVGQELPDVKPPEKLSYNDLRKMIVKTNSKKEEKFNRTEKLVKLKPLGL
jgi:putative transposase